MSRRQSRGHQKREEKKNEARGERRGEDEDPYLPKVLDLRGLVFVQSKFGMDFEATDGLTD
jgi:hypothetical protein